MSQAGVELEPAVTDHLKRIAIRRFENGRPSPRDDYVVVEEPLEIRLVYGPPSDRKTRSLSVTMRTPGNDFELATGFLISEGIVRRPVDIIAIRFVAPFPENDDISNVVEVELDAQTEFEPTRLQRHFYTTSSCGVCGKASLEAIRVDNAKPFSARDQWPKIETSLIHRLPSSLRKQQAAFQQTGGLHAAGLATIEGDWIVIREDVGRHNAVDKVVGNQFLKQKIAAFDRLLMLSGRASFELMQKALLARIPIVIAVGAPSSLAVELALEFGMTLIGFTSETKFNIYAGASRVFLPED